MSLALWVGEAKPPYAGETVKDLVSALGATTPGTYPLAIGLLKLVNTLGQYPDGVSADAQVSVGVSVTSSLATIQVQFKPAV